MNIRWFQGSRKTASRGVTALVFCVLLGATLALWHNVRDRENARAFDRQIACADTVRTAIQEQLSNLDNSLRWNERQFLVRGTVSQATFQRFNQNSALHSSAMATLEWSPRIWARDRKAFEAGTLWPRNRPTSVLNPAGDGTFYPAPEAGFYAPIAYAYTRSGASAALGMNIVFSEERRAAYAQSARQGAIASTGVIPIYLSTAQSPVPGLVRSQPVYDVEMPASPEARWTHLLGWMSIAIDLEALFASAIDPNLTPDFDVFIFQKNEKGSWSVGHRTRLGASTTQLPDAVFDDKPYDFVQSVYIGDQIFGLVIRPNSAWFSALSHAESNLTLTAGLLLTTLVLLTLERQRRFHGRIDDMHEKIAQSKVETDAANDKLRATVAELHRTRESLLQSEKLTALGTMVAGISHELNTPIGNALLASSTLNHKIEELRARFENGSMTKSLMRIFFNESLAAAELLTRAITIAADLVSNFKTMAVDQTARLRRSFLLDKLVGDCVATTLAQYPALKLTTSVEVDADIWIDSFSSTLEQVIAQLLGNCVSHGFEGRDAGTIQVVGTWASDARDIVCVSIEDDGRGIEQAHLQQLFDPFFTTRMGSSSGLGLSMVYRLVTNVLGGQIDVQSTRGRGTRVRISFPVCAPQLV